MSRLYHYTSVNGLRGIIDSGNIWATHLGFLNDLSEGRAAAANEAWRMPPRLFSARCTMCWFLFGLVALTAASFWTLDLQWARFFSADAMARMGRFLAELLNPSVEPQFLWRLAMASLETLAMSGVGTLLAHARAGSRRRSR